MTCQSHTGSVWARTGVWSPISKLTFFPLCCPINATCSPLALCEDAPIQKGVGWQPPRVEGSPLGQNHK